MNPRTLTTLVAGCLASLASLAPAQVSPALAEQIKKEGLKNSQVMQYLDHLTNQIGHRLTGSDSFMQACEWTRSEFEKMGLEANLEKWGQWKLSWNRGQWQGRVVEPVEMDLQVATDAWTLGTKGLQRGEVIRMPSRSDIDERVKGKWLITRRLPRSLKAAAENGALGVLYSSRGDRKHPNRIRVFGSYRQPKRDLPRICIRRDQFVKFWDLTEDDKKVVAEFDIRNRFRDGVTPLYNVVADIKGTEKPDEYVIVCGHLDSWHQATGTTDNGTGATSTMEAARILAAVGAKPKRTIRFILWGGEEQGLLGSVQYVRRHRSEMAKISCVFNHDTGTNWAQNLQVTTGQLPWMEKVFQPVMSMTPPDEGYGGDVFNLRATKKLGGFGGSDHASFLAAGVPAYAWGLRGRADYFSYTWHSQWDTYDEAIPEYQRHTATVIALAALGVANLPELLPRGDAPRPKPRADAKPIAEARLGITLEGLEVKSVRDGSVAAAAGMTVGDKIVLVNDGKITSTVQLVAALRDNQAPWVITVMRGEKRVGLLVEQDRKEKTKK